MGRSPQVQKGGLEQHPLPARPERAKRARGSPRSSLHKAKARPKLGGWLPQTGEPFPQCCRVCS